MAESSSPEPLLIEEEGLSDISTHSSLPPILQDEPDAWKDFPWSKFPGHVKATRPGNLSSWIWRFGYDIELASMPEKKRWVCQRCVMKREPANYNATGHQNIERHLQGHGLEDPTGRRKRKRSDSSFGEISHKQRRISDIFKLNANLPREQALINTLKLSFSRDHLQRLLVNWIIEANLPFRTIEHPRLREALMYLNPLVQDTNALITHPTARQILVNEFERHHHTVVHTLRNAPGQIHIAFDGWRSRNRHALFGITCTFLDCHYKPQKLVLGLPELQSRHTGDNIAAEIIEILESYEIGDKIGYFTLDNAANNDTAMEAIAKRFNLPGGSQQRRIRCIGHVINLIVKALLFGKGYEALEDDLLYDESLEAASHNLWLKQGPVGKLHNLVTWINRSDALTQSFLRRQKDYADKHPSMHFKVLHIVVDNATRWLSQYHMIKRALRRKEILEDLWDDELKAFKRSNRGKEPPPCLRPESQLTAADWVLLRKLHDLLHRFNEVLEVLEGDSQFRERVDGSIKAYGLIWNVLFAYEYMLEALEKAQHDMTDDANADRWKRSINNAWQVARKYYDKIQESPVYYAAVALHPRWRWRWLEGKWASQPDWIAEAQGIVKDLWDNEYKKRPAPDNTTAYAPSRVKGMFLSPFDQFRDAARLSSPFDIDDDLPADEYERWQLDTAKTDADVDDPLQYWYHKRSDYPRLAQMAIEVLSVQPMSAECERLFSSGGLMVSSLRTRLEATTIGMAQTLRSWLKAGLIEDSVMNVPDLNTKKDREISAEGKGEGKGKGKSDGDSLKEDSGDEATAPPTALSTEDDTLVVLDD